MNKLALISVAALAAAFYLGIKPKGISAAQIEAGCDVVMFTTKTCGYCAKARIYFAQKNVNTCEKDTGISQNHHQFKELGGRGVPLVIIGEQRISGYNVNAFEKALAALQH